MDTLIQDSGLQQLFIAALLGMPRLFILMLTAPFFGNNVLSGQLQTAFAISLYLLLHPLVYDQALHIELSWVLIVGILAKEVILGFFLGYLAGMPFWLAQSTGFFIDNQRGASMAESADPLSGDQTSPFGSLLFQILVFLFFSTGAFVAFLTLVYSSYTFWPVTSFFPTITMAVATSFIQKVDWMMMHMLLLAGPITVACLLVDISLGLINRFASQLNVYILAMPIKSGIVAFLLLIYLGILINRSSGLYGSIGIALSNLQEAMP